MYEILEISKNPIEIAAFSVVDEDLFPEDYLFSLHDTTGKFQLDRDSGTLEAFMQAVGHW